MTGSTRCRSALALVWLTVAVAGCDGGEPPSAEPAPSAGPAAEISDAGVNCLSTEVVVALSPAAHTYEESPAPASGSVPPDFRPVAVVQCGLTTSIEQRRPPPGPPANPLDAEHLADREAEVHMTLTIAKATLDGDLDPLLEALERPPEPAMGGACPTVDETVPQIFLVDDAGRTIRPQWPVTSCGLVRKDSVHALKHFDVVAVESQSVNLCLDCPDEDLL